MIRCICRTNVDEGRNKKWPAFLACRPEIGDQIMSSDRYTLTIVEFKHWFTINNGVEVPIIEVELNK